MQCLVLRASPDVTKQEFLSLTFAKGLNHVPFRAHLAAFFRIVDGSRRHIKRLRPLHGGRSAKKKLEKKN